jgi:hypothetical protein
VKVGTPLGEYPFEFRRIERRDCTLAIVGTVAGLESSVVLGAGDLRAAARALAIPLATGAALIYLRSRRSRSARRAR